MLFFIDEFRRAVYEWHGKEGVSSDEYVVGVLLTMFRRLQDEDELIVNMQRVFAFVSIQYLLLFIHSCIYLLVCLFVCYYCCYCVCANCLHRLFKSYKWHCDCSCSAMKASRTRPMHSSIVWRWNGTCNKMCKSESSSSSSCLA